MKAVGGVLGQARSHHPVQRLRLQRGRVALEDRADQAGRIGPLKRSFPGDHFVEHQAERENVAARVSLPALQLLGGHVLQGTDDLPLVGEGLGYGGGGVVGFQDAGAFGQAKVQQLGSLPGDQDVGRLEIAVDNALVVRGVEGVQNLPRVFHGFGDRQRAFQLRAIDRRQRTRLVGPTSCRVQMLG